MNSYEKELRIGLVLYGGVSLCMYIFGVVYEFLRFIRREGAYKGLAEDAKVNPVIDVISGTSAGGINGIFLAKALATGASLDSLKSLWINQGDLNDLIDLNKNPISLLNSTDYQNKLETALNKLEANPEKVTDFELLDLFITATDLDGVIKKFEGGIFSHQVITKGHDTVFQFKLRPQRYNKAIALDKELLNRDRTGRNDFSGKDEIDKNKYFAKIAAATSAFPVAFAPVSFTKVEKNEMKNLFMDHVCKGNVQQNTVYGDGGMVNNRPFNYTVHTIFHRQADTVVDRKLFFVEPDPETLKLTDNKKIRLADRDITADGFDSLKGLFEAGLYQSIAEDLENLFKRNDKVLEVRMVVHAIEHELSKYICGQNEDCKKIIRNNPVHKIYMNFKINKLLLKIKNEFYDRIEDRDNLKQIKRKIDTKLEELSNNPVDFLQTFDYPFRMRRIRYFISKINSWFREHDLSDSLMKQLGDFKIMLYNFIEYYNHESWRITEHGTKLKMDNIDESFDKVIAEYKEMMSPVIKNKARTIISELEKISSDNKLDDIDISLVDVYDAYEFLDMHLYPVIVLSETGEVDPIEVVRISPDIATHYSKGNLKGSKAINEKLAGEKLMHFSAFLKKSWRENDILQGRLDAAEIISNTVINNDNQKAEYYTAELCKGIVEEELKSILLRCKDSLASVLISEGEKEKVKEILEEKYGLSVEATEKFFIESYKVGSEELKDIEKRYLLRVAAKATRTFGLMLRRFPQKSSPTVANYISRPVNIISKINNYIYSLVMAFTGELKNVFRNVTIFLLLFITALLLFNLFGWITIRTPIIWGAIALLAIWLIFNSKAIKIIGTIIYLGFLIYYFFRNIERIVPLIQLPGEK